MRLLNQRWCGGRVVIKAALCTVLIFAQPNSPPIQPLRTMPVEKLKVNPGFRDWGPVTVAGTTILSGNQTNVGGLFAIDMLSGKVKWSHRPTFSTGTASVSTPPAVSGDIVIMPYAEAHPGAVMGVSLATGKEVWRGPDPAGGAGVLASEGLAYILGKNGKFYALEAATGREKWTIEFSTQRAVCASRPILRDGVIYLTGSAEATPGDATKQAGYYLFAIDARTGQERWRYRAEAPYVHPGVCLLQPVVTADTVFATGESRVYAVNRATGGDRWKPVEIRRAVEGRVRAVEVFNLVDAGTVLIGMTKGFLMAFDKDSGRIAWELPGQYRNTASPPAVAGNVLYFQGSPDSKPAAAAVGTLHALDLDSRTILWSFARVTAQPNWPFGSLTPVDGGLWVASYQALIKLQ